MTLKKFFRKFGRAGELILAERVKTHPVYLYQCRMAKRRPSPKLVQRLIKASDGVLTKHGLRPDIWKKGEL